MNPLSAVCCQRNPDLHAQRTAIEGLLAAGAKLDEVDKNLVTAIHHAVRFRNPAAVEALLRAGAAVNQACTRSDSTALHRAVTTTGAPGTAGKDREARKIIELLLKFGADVAIKNKQGKLAADYARDEEIRGLLTGK